MTRHYDGWAKLQAGCPGELREDLAVELHPGAPLKATLDTLERGARGVLRLHYWPAGWISESADCTRQIELGPEWQPDPEAWSIPIGTAEREAGASLRREGLTLLYWIAALRIAIDRGDTNAAIGATFQIATERDLIRRALDEGDRINKGFSQEHRGRKDDVMIERRRRDRELRDEGVKTARRRAEIIADERGEDSEAVRKSLRKMH